MSSGKFYRLIGILLLVGACWLVASYYLPEAWTPCLFHNLTGWPCPACGTTRAMQAFFDGHIHQSLLINPLGLLVGLTGILMLPILLVDYLSGKQRLYTVYLKGERRIKQPSIALAFGFVILANWIWNISKAL